MARFYSNECSSQRTVKVLRQLGHDVLTSHEAGQANQGIPDEEVLTFATKEGRALLTLNRKHFKRLHHATREQHAGIIVCTRDADFQGQAQRIHAAIAGHATLAGKLIRVNRPNP